MSETRYSIGMMRFGRFDPFRMPSFTLKEEAIKCAKDAAKDMPAGKEVVVQETSIAIVWSSIKPDSGLT